MGWGKTALSRKIVKWLSGLIVDGIIYGNLFRDKLSK